MSPRVHTHVSGLFLESPQQNRSTMASFQSTKCDQWLHTRKGKQTTGNELREEKRDRRKAFSDSVILLNPVRIVKK